METIENFLPIHACCAQGHFSLMKYLLQYDYRSDLLNMYEDGKRGFKYVFAFDLNALDCNEQSILYTCVATNNIDDGSKPTFLRFLLEFKVRKLSKYEVSTRKSINSENRVNSLLKKYQLNNSISRSPDVRPTHSASRSSSIFEQFKNFIASPSPQTNAQIDEHLNVKFTNRYDLAQQSLWQIIYGFLFRGPMSSTIERMPKAMAMMITDQI